uniref:Uncharacterized protein n=1 Tax=Quercus lobata TaxID=97700 RepID=A0A7N2LKN2_QUELO
MKPLAIENFPYINLATESPASIQQSSVVKHICELLGIDAKTFTFSYAELKAATEDFSPDNKLGEGGFGPVYKSLMAQSAPPVISNGDVEGSNPPIPQQSNYQ